jgi:GT2 family glycosyltransferase
MKKITIVVLHYINQKLTSNCLESIKKLNTKDLILQIIVVNNNPKENLKDLKRKFKRFIFLDTGENLGFAEGNNVGIRKALDWGADYVFIVNNDTILDKNLVVQIFKVASLNNQIGIVAPKIYFAPGYEYHKMRYKESERGKVFWYTGGLIDWGNILTSHRGVDEVDKGQYDKQRETDFTSGCAMFVRQKVFKKIGLFDKRYFLYLEDVDFCQRARRTGFKVIYTPRARLWHANAASSAVGGPLQDYYITRNRMLFGIRYAPWRTKIALFKESVKLLFAGRQWQRIGIRDFYLRKFGKGSYET